MANQSKNVTETHAKWMIRKQSARDNFTNYEFILFMNLIEKLKEAELQNETRTQKSKR